LWFVLPLVPDVAVASRLAPQDEGGDAGRKKRRQASNLGEHLDVPRV
jgi:hypothetical protein